MAGPLNVGMVTAECRDSCDSEGRPVWNTEGGDGSKR